MILWKTDKEIDKIARMIFTSTIPLVKIQHCPPICLGGFCYQYPKVDNSFNLLYNVYV